MSGKTDIQWTDKVWNPVTGCTKVSPGCKNCYAEAVANRFWKGRAFTDVRCHEDRLDQPLRWKKASRIFVNSMSDLFHEDVPDDFIIATFGAMFLAPQHTYQILTKRPERMCALLNDADKWRDEPRSNIWLGVSVENQEKADERIPILLQTSASVRFLSVEPLLEAVELEHPLGLIKTAKGYFPCPMFDSSDGRSVGGGTPKYLGDAKSAIDWVIVGGESGPGARPCNIEWIREIVAQCRSASVPAFVKQLGSRVMKTVPNDPETHSPNDPPDRPYDERWIMRDRKGGDVNEWPEDLRIREFPA